MNIFSYIKKRKISGPLMLSECAEQVNDQPLQKGNLFWSIVGTVVLSTCFNSVKAQVNIGSSSAPNSDAMLQVSGSDKGLLMPRIALTATTSASPLNAFVAGMVVYNTATAGTSPNNVTPGFYVCNGSNWVATGNKLNLKSLTNSTTPAGAITGEIAYNTNSGSGVAAGPVYWNGTGWISVNTATPGGAGMYFTGSTYSYLGIDLGAIPTVEHNIDLATFADGDAASDVDISSTTTATLFNSLSAGGAISITLSRTALTTTSNMDIVIPSPAAYVGKTFYFYLKPNNSITLSDNTLLILWTLRVTGNKMIQILSPSSQGEIHNGGSFQGHRGFTGNYSGASRTNSYSMVYKVHALTSDTWVVDASETMLIAAN